MFEQEVELPIMIFIILWKRIYCESLFQIEKCIQYTHWEYLLCYLTLSKVKYYRC